MLPIKRKIIEEYSKMLKEYEKGKTYKYDYILDMINFLDVREYLNNPASVFGYTQVRCDDEFSTNYINYDINTTLYVTKK